MRLAKDPNQEISPDSGLFIRSYSYKQTIY